MGNGQCRTRASSADPVTDQVPRWSVAIVGPCQPTCPTCPTCSVSAVAWGKGRRNQDETEAGAASPLVLRRHCVPRSISNPRGARSVIRKLGSFSVMEH